MRFTKMHGIGNDYIFVNGFETPAVEASDLPRLARELSDRHFGVGGDGLILVLRPEHHVQTPNGAGADLRMRMFNADGSEAEMCGNGIRCACKFASDHGVTEANPMRIQTGAGLLSLTYVVNGHGKVEQVTVDMGSPTLEPARIPVNITGLSQIVNHPSLWPFDHWADKCKLDRHMTCVSMGNPHVVFFCADVTAVPLEQAGPQIECHSAFPRRTNVHFVQVQDRAEAIMRTWERGSGITLACGTGASAACVAGMLTDRTDREILMHLPGGDLTVEWREADQHVYLTGPATEVFTGQWTPSLLC